MQPFCCEAEDAFYEITPFGGDDFSVSAKWLFNDVERDIITAL